MKRILIILIVGILLASCTNLTEKENSTGSLNLSLSLGEIGRAISNRITMSKIVITLNAEGEDEITTENALTSTSGTVLLKEFSDLVSDKEWTINVKSYDINSIEIHEAAAKFTLLPEQVFELNLDLSAKYSVLYARFSPIKDSVNKCEIIVDDITIKDSSFALQSLVGESIGISYDYFSASNNGIEHKVTLNVYGQMWGADYLLYTGDTTILVNSGNKVNCNLDLKWVGPDKKPDGDLGISVNIGVIDTVFINGNLIDNEDNDTDTQRGLILYYPFNGNSNDESGIENHGSQVNVELVEDRFGKLKSAYFFDGTLSESNPTGHEAYIYAVDNSTINFSEVFSFSVWVKGSPIQEREGAGIVTKGIGHHNEQYLMDVYYNYYRFLVNNQYGSTSRIDTHISPSNTWEHLVGVYDLFNGVMKLYLNGIEVGNTSPIGSLKPTTEPLVIGSRRKYSKGGYNLNFKGSIDDVRIYNRVITENEIQLLFNECDYPGNL